MDLVKMLKRHDVIPVMVFDGAALPGPLPPLVEQCPDSFFHVPPFPGPLAHVLCARGPDREARDRELKAQVSPRR